MATRIFYRNIRAREQFELFLLSAIGSLLTVRFLLHVTGYPQLGGNGLHIAHMLWGGLLMVASIIISMAFVGMRVARLSAIVGGLGFGIFIDEIGKFLTSDNNYFFRPAVGIIYAIFVIMYLTFNFLSRDQKLTSREYQLNALLQLEEAIVHDMDQSEKERAKRILSHADHEDRITTQLRQLLDSVELVPQDKPLFLRRWLSWLDRTYTNFWQRRSSHRLIRVFFLVETLAFIAAMGFDISRNFDGIHSIFRVGATAYDSWLFLGQLISSVVAAGFAAAGAIYLTRSRLHAFEEFRRATLINLYLTEFFIFSRVEFRALPGFIFNVVVLLFITYVLHQEHRQARLRQASQ